MKKYIIYVLLLVIAACYGKQESSIDSRVDSQGIGGSLARFAIVGDKLYTVDNQSLKWFDISVPTSPVQLNATYVGRDIETIFPRGEHLFIGSQRGMFVYQIDEDGMPDYLSQIQHFYSCDPVVANGTHAYVTLRSGSTCRSNPDNELWVIELNDLQNMEHVRSYEMINPKGLGVSGNNLFVCDKGIKVFDITDPLNLKQLYYFDIKATDVIPVGKLILVVGDDGFYQYEFSNGKMALLSHIPVQKENAR